MKSILGAMIMMLGGIVCAEDADFEVVAVETNAPPAVETVKFRLDKDQNISYSRSRDRWRVRGGFLDADGNPVEMSINQSSAVRYHNEEHKVFLINITGEDLIKRYAKVADCTDEEAAVVIANVMQSLTRQGKREMKKVLK